MSGVDWPDPVEMVGGRRARPGEPVCEYALCRRAAEVEVLPGADATAPVRVCGLHLSPVLSWGVVPVGAPVVVYLGPGRDTAA